MQKNRWEQLGDQILHVGGLFFIGSGVPFFFGVFAVSIRDPLLFVLWFIMSMLLVLGMLAGILAIERAKEALSREVYTDIYNSMQK